MKSGLVCAVVVLASLGCGGSTSGGDAPGADSGPGPTADTTPNGTDGAPGDGGDPGGPLSAPDETWTWFDVAGTQCANGTPTGLGVNLTTKSKKLLVYLEGGGACWDASSCGIPLAANLDGYGPGKFASDIKGAGNRGVFARGDAANPFKDYSYVIIPYCTGDVHAGHKDTTYKGSVGLIHHQGYANMTADLQRIVPTFKDAESVVLGGSSAGGYGALFNFVQVQEAFGKVHVDLVDDAGPPMRPPYMPLTLQQKWTDSWGLDTTLPADCTKCNATDGFHNAVPYLSQKYPGHRVSLISSLQDQTIRNFMGITPDQMQAGLADLVDNVLTPSAPDWRVFFVAGQKHTFALDALSSTSTNGTTLADFLTKQLSGDPGWANVRP